MQVGYRAGDVWSPHIEPGEALQTMVKHFADCIQSGSEPITDAEQGVRIVRYLEAATRSIRAQGGRIVLAPETHTNGHTNGKHNGQLLANRA
jgi:hypothetical protein